MREDISTSSKWTAAVSCLLVWLVLCVPFWLLGMGFAGTFVLPSITLHPTDMFLFSLIYFVFFYGLLLCAVAMGWSAFRDGKRNKPKTNLED